MRGGVICGRQAACPCLPVCSVSVWPTRALFTGRHEGLCKNCILFVHAEKIEIIFNVHMEHNVNLVYLDTRRTFGAHL